MFQTTIVLATRNAGKIQELAGPLAVFGLNVLGLEAFPEIPDLEETGDTFAANALLKAGAVAKATGLTAVADDSGLSVDALSGAPGVYSARYWQAGDAVAGYDAAGLGALAQDARNNLKLLAVLAKVPKENRTATFCCTMCAVHPGGGEPLYGEGRWQGSILREQRGAGGFGYDPLFFDAELGLCAAQMPRETKMARSHRGMALEKLLAAWGPFWARRPA